MTELLSAIAVALVAFVGTNLENLILLVGLMATRGVRPRVVGSGYLLAVALVVGVSLGLGTLLGQIDPRQLRWVGLIPLGMGLFLGARAIIGKNGDEQAVPDQALAFWSTFGITIAHSMDSLAVFGPLFAETKSADLWLMVATMGVAAVLAAMLSGYLATHPRLGRRLEKVATVAVPVLLLAVGIYILTDTPTDL